MIGGCVWFMRSQVARNSDLQEFLKLEYLKEIGFCHMRIGDGVNSRLQLSGLLAKLCKITMQSTG
jgi:replication factor C subunit 2/4